MACQLIVRSTDKTRRKRTITYEPTFSGNYPGAAGEVLDFSAATNPNAEPNAYPFEAPERITIDSPLGSYSFRPIVGVANNDAKLRIFSQEPGNAAGAGTVIPLTEHAAAAYNAAIIADDDKVRITAVFRF